MEETNVLHVDTDSQKLKADQKFIGRNKLIFFHAGTNSGKLKVDSIIFGWALSKMALFSSCDPKVCCFLRMNI